MIKSLSPRYSLRKEYFGGLLLDYRAVTFELLTSEEYQLLEDLLVTGNDLLVDDLRSDQLRDKVRALQRKGIIDTDENGKLSMVDIRLIPTPDELPVSCLSAPIRVYDTYTRRCNLECEHCYAFSGLAFTEAKRTLEQTEEIMRRFCGTGTMEWQFTGGEPTTAPDLWDAIDIAKGFGMAVSLNTNGCWSNHVAEKIVDSGINGIVISLEGPEGVNDRRRGAGVFGRVMETLDRLARYNQANPDRRINVVLNMAVGRDNVADVEFVVRLAAGYRFGVNFVPLKASGRAAVILRDAMLSKEEYMKFAEQVQRLREDPHIQESGISVDLKHKDLFCPSYPDKSDLPYPFNYSECAALATAISLLPDGRVFACPFLMDEEQFIGPSILDVSVYDAWLDPTMEYFRNAKKIGCTNCRFYMRQCRGKCRAAVLLSNGRIENGCLLGEDPYCFKDLLET